ncbi:hypothetical protein SAMN05720468_12729 [Fibrobacter sp. UWEL]|nr:hypothetical protein SAMN05720468_12729 [Fibrobacter sp. UWEL]
MGFVFSLFFLILFVVAVCEKKIYIHDLNIDLREKPMLFLIYTISFFVFAVIFFMIGLVKLNIL